MKKTKALALLMVLLLSAAEAIAQTWLWPIKNYKPGQGILYRPQDYLGNEQVFSDLIIGAPEGTQVLCPADGIVTDCSLSLEPSLTFSYSFTFDSSYEETLKEARQEAKKLGIDERYICGWLGLRVGNQKLYMTGIRLNHIFKTGTRLKRGQILGTVGYTLPAISRPHISIAVSSGVSDDPMTPFGLKSTFKAPVAKPQKKTLTHAEAEKDLRQLASAVREIYPSLTDLMSLAKYDAFVESLVAKIPATISISKFSDLISQYNARIHDSHISINNFVANPSATVTKLWAPMYFGRFGSKCLITMTSRGYAKYRGKEVVKIDGKPVSKLCDDYGNTCTGYDAQVQSFINSNMAFFPMEHYMKQQPASKKAITYEFANGEHIVAKLIPSHWINDDDYDRWVSPSEVNTRYDGKWTSKMLSDSVKYIGLRDFDLNNLDEESLIAEIHSTESFHIPVLIFDLRNNPGGSSSVLEHIQKALMGRMKDKAHESYQMANAISFKSPLENYIAGETILNGFYPVKGKSGVYSQMDKASDAIDPQGYNGKLYILVNERSASASAFLAGCIKRNRRGIIIGRETRSAYHVETAEKFANIYLDNSQFTAQIPIIRFVIDTTVDERFPAGRGVIPDYDFPFTYDEYMYKGDYILDKAFEIATEDHSIQGIISNLMSHWYTWVILLTLFGLLWYYWNRREEDEV